MMLNEADEETGALYTTIRDELIAKGKTQGIAEGKTQGIAEGRTQGIAEGEVRGAAQMLERLLDARGVALTDALRRRIRECTDSELLQRWFGRAVTATTTAEVFDD